MSGRVEAIWLKRMRRGPMDAVREARLVTGRGLVGNANQGGKRQVTLIEREVWDAMMASLGTSAPPTVRRANVMVSGFPLARTRGRVLRVGDGERAVRLRVYGETRPCELMEEQLPGLRAAMSPDWHGGVFAEVLDDGEIVVGDRVEWEEG